MKIFVYYFNTYQMRVIEYIRILAVVNTVGLIGGVICAMYGLSIIPQVGSSGFTVLVIGVSIVGGNIISLVLSCCYIRYKDTHTIHPIEQSQV